MPIFNNIDLFAPCQGYIANSVTLNQDGSAVDIAYTSTSDVMHVRCPHCGGKVSVHDIFHYTLKDMPFCVGVRQILTFTGPRFKCQDCGKTFHEEIPIKHPGTRITERAACWIRSFMKHKMTISSIQEITGIHWDTIRFIQKEHIEEALSERQSELNTTEYKPRILAVDEFAIHKGHTYATCVMDLETGEVIWVGKGRSKADFNKFFEEVHSDQLKAVVAVAMDMNASYNQLIEEKMPWAKVVYDRYHLQAQYGKEVLGVVRLTEAERHKQKSRQLQASAREQKDNASRNMLMHEAKVEKKRYRTVKKARWALLKNKDKLSEKSRQALSTILRDHADLSVCYAMKEEMVQLYSLTDPVQAKTGWERWFNAAEASGIDALVHFAEIKKKRLPGLIAHATFPISTSKLEGFNNKIKVAKRIAYGYRDDEFFFSLIRYLSLPSVRCAPNYS